MDFTYDIKCYDYSSKNDIEKALKNSLYTNILYVKSGSLTFSYCGKSDYLYEKEIIILFPCSDISILDSSDANTHIYIISYFIHGNDIHISADNIPKKHLSDSELSLAVKAYLAYTHETTLPISLKRKSLEYSIMHLAENELFENGRKIPEKLFSVLLYIHNNYSENISAEKLAEVAQMSESSLYGIFSDTLKISPKQYIRKYRMIHAMNLLSCTCKTVSEISLETGFYDQFYFSKEFKKDFGISPSEYRKISKD